MNDLVSVIVSIYNDEKNLKDCIISLIGQTYRNLEIILIDDGSTDGSAKICDDLVLTSSKMKLVHRMHSGLGDSRNIGLDMATGKYVTFVNGSDTIKNDMIETLYKMMQNYPVDIAMCSLSFGSEQPKTYIYPSTRAINTSGNYSSSSNTVITLSHEDAIRQLLLGKTLTNTVCGILFKKELFNSIKFSDDNSDVVVRLIELSKKTAFVNMPAYHCKTAETFSNSSLINRDIRIMKLYPNLEIYCQYDILKNIQNEFYDAICNNKPLINADNMYKMFMQIVKEKEEKISPFLSYRRKAHMYLMADDLNTYKRICPVLPELSQND